MMAPGALPRRQANCGTIVTEKYPGKKRLRRVRHEVTERHLARHDESGRTCEQACAVDLHDQRSGYQ
jgi:hypothetical protein